MTKRTLSGLLLISFILAIYWALQDKQQPISDIVLRPITEEEQNTAEQNQYTTDTNNLSARMPALAARETTEKAKVQADMPSLQEESGDRIDEFKNYPLTSEQEKQTGIPDVLLRAGPAKLRQFVKSQLRDEQWAAATEQSIRTFFTNRMEMDSLTLHELECWQTFCQMLTSDNTEIGGDQVNRIINKMRRSELGEKIGIAVNSYLPDTSGKGKKIQLVTFYRK
ncbi:hypothetical protein [Neptunicella sp. SCSIO 80796]|uniref:hypothetical protein n=1 Tax=Neptunicella plasticusilytica TaxID=3117012 RepID=UPI003A4D30F3